MKTILLAGMIIAAGGLAGHGQTTNVVSTNSPASAPTAVSAAAKQRVLPASKSVKTKYDPAPKWRDVYHYSEQTDPALMAAYSRSVHDSVDISQREKADRMAWANAEGLFRLQDEWAGESFIDSPIVTIFPPGK